MTVIHRARTARVATGAMVAWSLSQAGCTDSGRSSEPYLEVITRVTMTFYDADLAPTEFTWSDPERDGEPLVDTVTLPLDGYYAVLVGLWNEAESGSIDVTNEISDEWDLHQVFLVGSAVDGPANPGNPSAVLTQHYVDLDPEGLPIGTGNGIDATAAGSGTLRLVLQHLGTAEGESLKVPGLAELVATSGLEALPGYPDVDVEFPVVVE